MGAVCCCRVCGRLTCAEQGHLSFRVGDSPTQTQYHQVAFGFLTLCIRYLLRGGSLRTKQAATVAFASFPALLLASALVFGENSAQEYQLMSIGAYLVTLVASRATGDARRPLLRAMLELGQLCCIFGALTWTCVFEMQVPETDERIASLAFAGAAALGTVAAAALLSLDQFNGQITVALLVSAGLFIALQAHNETIGRNEYFRQLHASPANRSIELLMQQVEKAVAATSQQQE